MMWCTWSFILGGIIISISAKVFYKCELASVLATKHLMPKDEVKNWVCIAEYESTFNTEAVNLFNWDGSKDFGLFQLNNKYWCDSDYGQNECRIPCLALLDDDLTDDLGCIRKIIKDTERWKGKGTGLTAWVAYVNRCQNQDHNKYMEECSNYTKVDNIPLKDEPLVRPSGEAITENITIGENLSKPNEGEIVNTRDVENVSANNTTGIENVNVSNSTTIEMEPSLLSLEKLDRSSPDLWPEQIPGVYDFAPLMSPQVKTENLTLDLDENDYHLLYQFRVLTPLEIIEEVKKLQNVAYQLGLEEAKEMTRGKYLHILNNKNESK